jgi:hypothetical protein
LSRLTDAEPGLSHLPSSLSDQLKHAARGAAVPPVNLSSGRPVYVFGDQAMIVSTSSRLLIRRSRDPGAPARSNRRITAHVHEQRRVQFPSSQAEPATEDLLRAEFAMCSHDLGAFDQPRCEHRVCEVVLHFGGIGDRIGLGHGAPSARSAARRARDAKLPGRPDGDLCPASIRSVITSSAGSAEVERTDESCM